MEPYFSKSILCDGAHRFVVYACVTTQEIQREGPSGFVTVQEPWVSYCVTNPEVLPDLDSRSDPTMHNLEIILNPDLKKPSIAALFVARALCGTGVENMQSLHIQSGAIIRDGDQSGLYADSGDFAQLANNVALGFRIEKVMATTCINFPISLSASLPNKLRSTTEYKAYAIGSSAYVKWKEDMQRASTSLLARLEGLYRRGLFGHATDYHKRSIRLAHALFIGKGLDGYRVVQGSMNLHDMPLARDAAMRLNPLRAIGSGNKRDRIAALNSI